ncbi:MAG: pyrroline-5-carboxylate reductase [Arcobacteraceae bacterium]
MEKLTFIGNGNMAKAIIKGLIGKYEIEVLGRNSKSLEALKEEIQQIQIAQINEQVDITDKNIILCIKPNSLDDLSSKINGTASSLYSVLAGVKLETLKEKISAKNYIRTMPNIAASFQKSMTTLTGDEILKSNAMKICGGFGSTLWVKSEKELDIATAVAGSGPAFLALIAESLSDGAVNNGLSRNDANILVQGLFDGFASLLKNNNPSKIKDAVMSPGGTTASGYASMEKNGVRNGMIQAIDSAYNKACELGKK